MYSFRDSIRKSGDRLTAYVSLPGDTLEVVLNKKIWWLLNLSSIPILLLASFLLGFHAGPAIVYLNIIFILSSIIPLIVFNFYKKHIENYALFTQLSMVVITSIKVYYMDGMVHAGTPLFVGLLGPVYAMTLPSKKRAVFVFVLYASAMIAATLLNPIESEVNIFSMYFLGFLISVTFIFFTLYYFTTRLEEAKRSEKKQMQELDDLKTKLYTHIAHEFRTPLSIITGMVDQMKNNPSEWMDEGHSIIKRNSNKLIDLTNKLLDLSKLEANAMPVNFVQDDIALYTRYLVESFHSLAQIKNIGLRLAIDPKEILMDFDPDKIRDIVSNLISNAIKFTPYGGSVRIALRIIDQNKLELSVKDTGIGIPREQLSSIFDRYFQAKNHLETLREGTGLGLALTKELVKLHQGTIRVRSILNKGSEFAIELPITNKAKMVQLPVLDEISFDKTGGFDSPKTPKKDNQLKLLIVEDNADVARYLYSLLSNNYLIETAGNGFEGLSKAIEVIPDLIISDVMMPVMDGFTLCKQLKEDIRTSHIPIVLLTARFDLDSRLEGLKTGADVFLAKPFNNDELFIRIEKLIALRKKLQTRYKLLEPAEINTKNRSQLSKEDLFMYEVRKVLEQNLSNEDFGIQQLCRTMAMSRAQLYRKFSALTDTTVYGFIRSLRLKKAKELLLTTNLNITEVAYDTGFKNLAHFSRVYTKEFGYAPSKTKI
ncbi:MAG: helix-turn-helix domain-containing protein [Flavobacteriaceae bacterium]|nr:helix-turn-helix domain-containing protein [Flavobacteriaceae bacterium]